MAGNDFIGTGVGMRFSCRLSYEARRKLKYQWHEWFAWHPVRVVPTECRWLEIVERKLRDGMRGSVWADSRVLDRQKP